LVPENDPSVLFTTAGMQQFKRYYLFPDEASSARVATCQKCLRTGDIDEVGDESHLTFFEMLGNFSFGYPNKEESYFKEEAISYAWEFLTEVLKIDKSRIYATYFAGDKNIPEDTVSREILGKIDGLAEVKPQGFEDNFWSLGTEGSPGGPTVEFYVDGIEVWNLVFNHFVFKNGEYFESDQKGVDTGMGLERLTAVIQGEKDVYKTDIYRPIIEKIEEISGKKYNENKKAFRIIADHVRAATALISDGVLPSNKDRGYVLRRLIRRAIIKGEEIGIKKNFVSTFSYENSVSKELEREESKFRETLAVGLKEFEKWFSWQSKPNRKIIPGSVVFDLYQTYGFPIELTEEIAQDRGLTIEKKEFERKLSEHQEKSRTASAGMFKGGLADNKVETMRLHTAAHLLLAALRQVLSPEVSQKGSNITEERLRFDFNWPEKLSTEQISEVEKIVNEKISDDLPVKMEEMSLEAAKQSGATGVFDDRYGEKVKVYSIDKFSCEICGGPHVERTGELGHFKIIKEESSSAGVRRIKAILE
ncbi:MAG TPA: alanine--tRNA ligase, partial [bacterium]|nr:alanine--tRNA ligase [bacterium]